MRVSINSNFTLSCNDTAGSIPTPTFNWFKDGEQDPADLLVPDDHVAIEIVSPTVSRLVFTDMQLSYAGTYSCKANNTKQKDIESISVNVECEFLILIRFCLHNYSMCNAIVHIIYLSTGLFFTIYFVQ